MKARRIGILVAIFALTGPARAHRLDEYLQASTVSVDRGHVKISLRMVPGVAVASVVMAEIDRDHDGSISATEAGAYVQRVLRDISLTVDGRQLSMHAVSSSFSSPEELESGRGEIHMTFVTDLSPRQTDRVLIFENRHQPAISAYLVNTLVPTDKAISAIRQSRNQSQSLLELAFVDSSHAVD